MGTRFKATFLQNQKNFVRSYPYQIIVVVFLIISRPNLKWSTNFFESQSFSFLPILSWRWRKLNLVYKVLLEETWVLVFIYMTFRNSIFFLLDQDKAAYFHWETIKNGLSCSHFGSRAFSVISSFFDRISSSALDLSTVAVNIRNDAIPLFQCLSFVAP